MSDLVVDGKDNSRKRSHLGKNTRDLKMEVTRAADEKSGSVCLTECSKCPERTRTLYRPQVTGSSNRQSFIWTLTYSVVPQRSALFQARHLAQLDQRRDQSLLVRFEYRCYGIQLM